MKKNLDFFHPFSLFLWGNQLKTVVLELNRNATFSFRCFLKGAEMFWVFLLRLSFRVCNFYFLSQSTFIMTKKGEGSERKKKKIAKTENLNYPLICISIEFLFIWNILLKLHKSLSHKKAFFKWKYYHWKIYFGSQKILPANHSSQLYLLVKQIKHKCVSWMCLK